jgi:VanZ family protein
MLPVQLKEELFSPDLGFSAGKALHIGVYAALAGSALLLPGVAGWRWLPIASLSLHALLTEYLQTFVQRSGCWEDVLIDHVGIVAGVAAAAGLLVWRSAPEAAER